MGTITGRKTSRFMIGLFVAVGSLIGVVLIVWMGASKYFERGVTYATYFDESVQGLQVDSSVKYRGVDVGRVLKIGVAPDKRLVEVVVKMHSDVEADPEKAEPDVLAQLKSAGITGIVFIELDRRQGDEAVLGPKMPFSPPYTVIPSRASDIRQIMTGLAVIYGKIQKIDFEGISDQLKGTSKSVESFFNNPRLSNTVKNVESTTLSLDRATQKIDRMLAEGKADQVLVDASDTLEETRTLMTELRKEIAAMKMADATGKAGNFVDHLDRRSRKISIDMEDTLQGLRLNSENLNRLLERLNSNPSQILFGNPEPYDRTTEEK